MKEFVREGDPRIPGIVIISHGALAVELLRSAEMICGEIPNVAALGVEPGESAEGYCRRLAGILALFPAGAFALADLTSGTPFNSLLVAMGERPLYGIAGANLPILLEIALARETKSLEELNRFAQEAIHDSICDLNQFQAELLES